MDSHNMLFTLLLGLTTIVFIDRMRFSWGMLVTSCFFALVATWLNTDYSWHGIGLMIVYYLFRKQPMLTVFFGFPRLMEYGMAWATVGLLFPLGYSGHRGFIHGKYLKYFFYLYYPIHLIVIWGYILI